MWSHKPQWATQTELRELREKVKRYEGEGRNQWAQGEPASEEARLEEHAKMEVDEEVDCRKKLGQ